MITYIFSGFNPKEHFGKEVSTFFKEDMKNSKSIVFIPGNFDSPDKVKRYALTDIEWFKEIDITLEDINILDNNMQEDTMKEELTKADIIFIMGGDTQKQNTFLEKYNLKETIKTSKGIVIGISAGAINLGIDSLCSKDLDDGVHKTILYKGIGRIPYTIEPHFDINNLELLNNELYPVSNTIKIYALPNDAGIRITNNNYKIIKGNFYLIDKEEVSMNIKNK